VFGISEAYDLVQASSFLFSSFFLFFSFIAVGATGLMVLEDYSLLDAVYMTVITITTVGYAEIHELGPEGRIFMMLLILAGFGTIAFAVTAITNFIFSGAYAQQVKQKKCNQP